MLALGLALTALLVPGSAAAQAPVDGVGFPQRLTQIGPDGDAAFDAYDPEVAYNSLQDEFLVVWSGTDPSAPGDIEIYGRLLNGVGAPKGPVHRLSEDRHHCRRSARGGLQPGDQRVPAGLHRDTPAAAPPEHPAGSSRCSARW